MYLPIGVDADLFYPIEIALFFPVLAFMEHWVLMLELGVPKFYDICAKLELTLTFEMSYFINLRLGVSNFLMRLPLRYGVWFM